MPRLTSFCSGGFRGLLCVVAGFVLIGISVASDDGTKPPPREAEKGGAPLVPEPKQVGGEPDGIVQVANLIYAGTKSSQCFSDHFLTQAEKDTSISTSRRFHAVKLGSEEVFGFPLVIMTGEGEFALTDIERENLRQYIQGGKVSGSRTVNLKRKPDRLRATVGPRGSSRRAAYRGWHGLNRLSVPSSES